MSVEETTQDKDKNVFYQMIDRIIKAHPEGLNYREEKEALCEEFVNTIKNMQGTELEPYLAQYAMTIEDGCFNLTFKIPLIPYIELIESRLKIPPLQEKL